jgi:citrate lyase subunit beta/citryl-CoA lyase
MNDMRPRRSVLFVPGSNARALERARALPTDALILDLEDAVAPEAKETARAQVCEAVRAGFGKRETVVRINALSTPWGAKDLAAAAAAGPDAILVPKVSTPDELRAVEQRLAGADCSLALWAMVETPLAILNIAALAGAGGRLSCLVMGTNDLIKEMRGAHTEDRLNLAAALSLSVLAARAHGLSIIDGVYNDVANGEGFAASCAQAKNFGFDGKTLIHPGQIEPCNAAFGPSLEEVETAKKIVAAFEEPENKRKGAIKLDGRMVERLHAESAKRTLALAQAIAALGAA